MNDPQYIAKRLQTRLKRVFSTPQRLDVYSLSIIITLAIEEALYQYNDQDHNYNTSEMCGDDL